MAPPSGANPDTSAGTDAAGADTDADSSGDNATGSLSISGRVADGYIRGAVICVDLDSDEACGDDEPSAVSGEGGSWSLELTAASAGFRRHQRRSCPATPTGRAVTGSPRVKRARSSASSRAEA